MPFLWFLIFFFCLVEILFTCLILRIVASSFSWTRGLFLVMVTSLLSLRVQTELNNVWNLGWLYMAITPLVLLLSGASSDLHSLPVPNWYQINWSNCSRTLLKEVMLGLIIMESTLIENSFIKEIPAMYFSTWWKISKIPQLLSMYYL